MFDFPGFTRRTEEVQEKNEAAFDLARRMLSSWVYRPIDPWLDKADLAGEVKTLTYMLSIQASRKFRSVIALCKDGEAENASIVARSMFETTLAAYFVLAPKFRIAFTEKPYTRIAKSSGKAVLRYRRSARLPRPGERCISLSQQRRALLYYAHSASEKVRVAKAISDNHFQMTGERLPDLDLHPQKEALKRISRRWRHIQAASKTYSGLRVKELASATKTWFANWYSTYKAQSLLVHSVDPFTYVILDSQTGAFEPRWFSNDFNIHETLYCGNMLFLAFIYYMNEQIGMGLGTNSLVRGFVEEMRALYQELPDGV